MPKCQDRQAGVIDGHSSIEGELTGSNIGLCMGFAMQSNQGTAIRVMYDRDNVPSMNPTCIRGSRASTGSVSRVQRAKKEEHTSVFEKVADSGQKLSNYYPRRSEDLSGVSILGRPYPLSKDVSA